MAEPKFTKGPWVVNTPPDDYLCVYSELPGAGRVLDWRICGDVDSWPNAHLIAAAPDLYEALDELLYRCVQDRGILTEIFGKLPENDALDKACANARKALAKARGEVGDE